MSIRFAACLSLIALCLSTSLTGKGEQDAPARARDPLTGGLVWRSIGPANMSGRVTDIAVPKGTPTTIYCATATGGVWKTINNGTTWTPIFDEYGSSSIGAIAVADSDTRHVWVGTGEANASSYTSWGDGVYKSTDGGETFTHMGLAGTHHIGSILIHPSDPDIVYVAALGHLWGPNAERGVYRTRDGGQTWTKVKFISADAGFVDLAMDPRNPRVIYAAAYARRSDRFDDYDSNGINVLEGGGLFKTTDGGDTWEPLVTGLPARRIGRIGLGIADKQPDRVYAIVEVAPIRATLPASDVSRIQQLLRGDVPPPAGEAARLRKLIEQAAPDNPDSVVVAGMDRVERAQLRILLGMPKLDAGGGVFRSDDAGRTWRRTSPLNEREGYYSRVFVDPNDADRVYLLMVRTWASNDGAHTFTEQGWAIASSIPADFIHGDFHALWIDPANSNHLIVGSDGGLYTTYDRGAHWDAHQMPIGQFVRIDVDMQRPYFVYGGLQDNGSWAGPSATRNRGGITPADWFRIGGADGAYTKVDPTNPSLMYTASQNGNILRIDLTTGQRSAVRPRGAPDGPAPRFNYVAPFVLSSRNPSTLYMGAERVFKSTNRGDTWLAVSGDLTKGEPNPDTAEGATITTLAESPVDPAVLWAGTDDGNLNVSRDGGSTWRNVGDGLPGSPRDARGRMKAWISRVEASHFEAGAAYVSLDAHRDDDFSPYVYRTRDYGQTWESLKGNLPTDMPVNVIREDRVNPNLLFAGTETSAFASIDGGRAWRRLGQGLPTVPIDDLVIHPRDPELVAGTHGRSIYVLDISALQQLTPPVIESDVHLFRPEPATIFNVDLLKSKSTSGARRFVAPNPYTELAWELDSSGLAPPGATIHYYLKTKPSAPVTITMMDRKGLTVRTLTGPGEAGINRLLWDLRGPSRPPGPAWRAAGGNDAERLARLPAAPGPLVPTGDYQIVLRVDGRDLTQPLRIEPDKPLR